MGQVVTFIYECQQDDCNGTAKALIDYLGHERGDPVEVDIEDISQIVLRCDECDTNYYTGDIDDVIFAEDDDE